MYVVVIVSLQPFTNFITMTRLFIFVLSLTFLSCKTNSTHQPTNSPTAYGDLISAQNLKEHLYLIASDSLEGRMTGSVGHEKALEYIENYYKGIDVRGGMPDKSYLQTVPSSYFKRGDDFPDSYNLLAFIEGSEYPNEVIVLSAHSDHIGIREDGEIFNGADDNGSGTVGVMEIARAFKEAAKAGDTPKRSILFLHVTGEEIGLYGSAYYADNPVYSLDNTICDLNIDMIGRVDPDKANNPDYVYLIGSDKISTELHDISEAANAKYTNLELDYTYNDENDPNRFYYRSDHYNFAKNGVPIIFYFNGVHEDYHDIGDTPDKIDYDLLAKRAKLVFYTAWEVANKEERLSID